jgi:raffinose/stachyose/melibiose transport system substrate-binding protein
MAALTAVCAVPMLVAACSGGSSGGASGGSTGGAPAAEDKAKEFSVLLTTENSQTPAMFKSLAAGACKAENDALPLKIDQTPSANMQQKIQLLAGQNALPVMFAAGTSLIAPGGDLDKAGQVLNIKDALTQLGRLRPGHPVGGRCRRQALQRRASRPFPLQSNIEGLFYNKKILADHGIAVPTTVAELTAAADKLKAAGVTPFTASGKTGWTISRWIGALLFRSLGPNAMSDIKAGKAKLTDPQYVAAAQQLQDMGKAGYFSNGVTNIDYDTEFSQMLNGQAAMMYMGSWFLAQVNDPKLNKVGRRDRVRQVPGRRRRQGHHRGDPGQRRLAERDVQAPVRPQGGCVAHLHRQELRQRLAQGAGLLLGPQGQHPRPEPAAADHPGAGRHHRDEDQRPVVRGPVQPEGHRPTRATTPRRS